jgi:hypothetical protein
MTRRNAAVKHFVSEKRHERLIWVAEEKLMPGALQGYTYVEDNAP